MTKNKPLKPADEKCIQEYLDNGSNQSAAYRIAFPRSKRWKDETVHTKAYQFFKRDQVQARLAELLQPAKEATGINIERTLKETAALAYSDISVIQTEDGKFLEPRDWPEDLRHAVKRIKYALIRDKKGNVLGKVIDVHFHDKNQALDKIFKHKGLYEADNLQKNPTVMLLEQLPPHIMAAFNEKLRELISKYGGRPGLDGGFDKGESNTVQSATH